MNETLSKKFLESLALEKQSDLDQTSQLISSYSPKILAKLGFSIINLCISQIKIGLNGKTSIELQKSMQDEELNVDGSFKNGDIVKICKYGSTVKEKKKLKGSSNKKLKDGSVGDGFDDTDDDVEGIVLKLTDKTITISIEGSNNEDKLSRLNTTDHFYIVKLTNSITYKRMESTMRKLAEMKNPSDLINLLLYQTPYNFPTSPKYNKIEFINKNLNQSQKDAIEFSLNSNISIIHGPPGTGKTYTLIETIQQLIKTGESKRILVCGASNICIDTILERLVDTTRTSDVFKKDDFLRIGHPSRLLDSIQSQSLENVILTSNPGLILKELRNDINKSLKQSKKTKSWKERRVIYDDIKEMKKDLIIRERKAIKEIILSSKVVISTLHGSSSPELLNCYKNNENIDGLFDTLIIDEVSQALEPQCWIPIISHPNIKKLIIAGDDKQLSPTIKLNDDDGGKNDKFIKILETTLFDRLQTHYKGIFTKMLTVQYRMNQQIMKFSSKELYNNRLKCGESCDGILLTDLIKDKTTIDEEDEDDILKQPLVWYDTQGGEFPERDEETEIGNKIVINPSKFNEMECYLVMKHIDELISRGIKLNHIGIISPYAAQVSKLKDLLSKKFEQKLQDEDDRLEISTVDGFQGREKEIIIISMVRSNSNGEVGFLKNFKRLNVGITRPKRQLCIIGDMETLNNSKNSFIKRFVSFMESESMIIYPDINELYV